MISQKLRFQKGIYGLHIIVSRQFPKLRNQNFHINCSFNLNLLESFLVDGPILGLFVKNVPQQLIILILLQLVLVQFLSQLPTHR